MTSTLMREFNRDWEAIAHIYGDRPALIPAAEPEKILRYADLNELIGRHLAWFSSIGLRTGDCIGALLPNSVEMLSLFLACLRGGMRFAPLACDTSPHEAVNWATFTRPACCVLGSTLPESAVAALKKISLKCLRVDTNGSFSHLPDVPGHSLPHASGAKLYLFTSGTTGQPKAIVIDGDKLWSAGSAFIRSHGVDFASRFRIWNYLPHSYLGGLFNMGLIPLSVGGSSIVDETFSGKTFLGFWQTIDRYEINALWLVPTVVRGLLAIGDRTHRNEVKSYREAIQFAFLGTAPIEYEAKRRFEALFGIPLYENFALSETTFLTTERARDIPLRSEGSTGRPLDYVELRFRSVGDDHDPRYREILAKTPFLADGYLDEDGAVKSSVVDGFLPTGDLGYLDESGQLILSGRCKDIIKKGGHLVALREVELLLASHPAVVEAVAVPAAHPFYGESYRLYVQLKPSEPSGALGAISAFVYENLAKHKGPDSVEAVAAFPRTPGGKIRKFVLKNSR
jgi:acyl-coenzyme A synthetase/AMP-(fatty) acid ligase